MVRIAEDYGAWLAAGDLPKLLANAKPGGILLGRQRDFCRAWPIQDEVTVAGSQFIQEDSPDEIGQATAAWRVKLLFDRVAIQASMSGFEPIWSFLNS